MTVYLRFGVLLTVLLSLAWPAYSQEWRSESLSPIDRQYMADQMEVIDTLARQHLGRQLSGQKSNDLAVLQRLLDDGIVGRAQVSQLQAMGFVLGDLLKREYNLEWVAYLDRRGRSRSLRVPGISTEFIFPITQISRRVEVGINVDVHEVYRELEQAVTSIKNKPLL